MGSSKCCRHSKLSQLWFYRECLVSFLLLWSLISLKFKFGLYITESQFYQEGTPQPW